MVRAGEDLVERLPETERAVANCELRRDGQAASLQVDQQLAPALRFAEVQSRGVGKEEALAAVVDWIAKATVQASERSEAK